MRQSSHTLRVVITAVAGAAVLLSACSDDGTDSTGGSEPAGPAVTTPAPEAGDGATSQADPTPEVAASEPAPVVSEPAEPLATASVPIDFIEGGELEMAATGLDVAGDLMRVAITFTASLPPGETDSVALGAVLQGNANTPGAGISPEVIDPVNLKAYEAVAGAIPNGTSVALGNGSPRTIVFYYAAPQDDVETLDVVVSSQAPTLTDITLDQ